jgi:hypothetical protein
VRARLVSRRRLGPRGPRTEAVGAPRARITDEAVEWSIASPSCQSSHVAISRGSADAAVSTSTTTPAIACESATSSQGLVSHPGILGKADGATRDVQPASNAISSRAAIAPIATVGAHAAVFALAAVATLASRTARCPGVSGIGAVAAIAGLHAPPQLLRGQ